MNAQAWTDFFKEAGLGPDVAATYGNIFFMNKIERSHLPYLNREVLGEMNISIVGHILMILKHARLVSDRVKCSTSAACIATTSSTSENQISPTVGTQQECKGPASEGDTQPEAQQCLMEVREIDQSLKQSPSFNNQDCKMKGTEMAEPSVQKHCKGENSEEAVNDGDKASHSESVKLTSQPVPEKNDCTKERAGVSDSDVKEEKYDLTEQHSSLLPTPTMPQNWLDPSRKHCESGLPTDDCDDKAASELTAAFERQNRNNPEDIKEEHENKSNISACLQENEPERPPILPEKICSPLLPTPVMPENWLDPSRRSTDSSFTAFSDGGHTNLFFQSECGGDLAASSFLQEANVNLNDHFISSSGTTYADPLYPQASLFPNDNSQSQNSSTFDPYAEYNDQTMQDRNFKAKSNPAWNKQVRQTQPYYRPQPQSAYGVSSYSSQLNETPVFQSNATGAFNMSSGYMYSTQPTNEVSEVHQWKH